MRKEFIILLLTVLVLVTSCANVEITELNEVNIDVNGIGHLITILEKDQRMVINLESNPTTGYTWEVVELNEQVLIKENEEFQPESDLDGTPGVTIFSFRAANPGQTVLKLVHHRQWETGVEPVGTFSLNIVVR